MWFWGWSYKRGSTVPQRPEETCLDEIPTIQEVEKAISPIKENKSAGPDGIPPELFTHVGQTVDPHLHRKFVKIWINDVIPADMLNANIITIFKKNDRLNVNNYRGISLLAVVGKIMVLVMLNRMRDPIAETVLPESQCGFRRNRGTTDMIFAVRQLMNKTREQHRNLYIAFVYFTKAFDTVNQNAMWVIMKKWDVPPKFVAILMCLNRDMIARILVDNELTSDIPYNNGVKLFSPYLQLQCSCMPSQTRLMVCLSAFARMSSFSTWLVSDHNPNVWQPSCTSFSTPMIVR